MYAQPVPVPVGYLPAPSTAVYVSSSSGPAVYAAGCPSGPPVYSGNSAANAADAADSAFRRIEQLNAAAERLYKIARVAPASLFRKDRLKWTASGGFLSAPRVCDDRSVCERQTMQLLSDMEVALDTVIAELAMVNKTLTGNVHFMTQFFVCCNRILALIDLLRGWQPGHGVWSVLIASGPFNRQSKLQAMAEVVESKIRGRVQAHFSLDMRASGAATADVQGGGVTRIDLTNSSLVSAASDVVRMQQGVTTSTTTFHAGDTADKASPVPVVAPAMPPRYGSLSPQYSQSPYAAHSFAQPQPQSYSSAAPAYPVHADSEEAQDPYASYGTGSEGAYRR